MTTKEYDWDLEFEKVCKERNTPHYVHETKNGDLIALKNLADIHLNNIIAMIERKTDPERMSCETKRVLNIYRAERKRRTLESEININEY